MRCYQRDRRPEFCPVRFLGKAATHAVVGEEDHERVLPPARLVHRSKDTAERAVHGVHSGGAGGPGQGMVLILGKILIWRTQRRVRRVERHFKKKLPRHNAFSQQSNSLVGEEKRGVTRFLDGRGVALPVQRPVPPGMFAGVHLGAMKPQKWSTPLNPGGPLPFC